jgi:hypothetical protein
LDAAGEVKGRVAGGLAESVLMEKVARRVSDEGEFGKEDEVRLSIAGAIDPVRGPGGIP